MKLKKLDINPAKSEIGKYLSSMEGKIATLDTTLEKGTQKFQASKGALESQLNEFENAIIMNSNENLKQLQDFNTSIQQKMNNYEKE